VEVCSKFGGDWSGGSHVKEVHRYKGTNSLFYIYILAEVPDAAQVNLQPAEHLKNLSFSFQGFKPPRPRGRGSNLHQNLPWIGGVVRGKFHQDWCRGLDFH